jgi:transposase
MDAAHLLHNAVPGHGWIKRNLTVELKTNSGRNRLNVLGAYSPDDHTLVSIEETTSCDAALVKRLLDKLRTTHPGGPLLLVLDNARYQRAYQVQDYAAELGIDLFFLPPYSPNLNLAEPKWVHGKRAVSEPNRMLSADELEARVYAYYGCTSEAHLTMPEKVA